MAQGEGMIKGGGNITGYSAIRQSKVRRYGRKVDLRAILRAYHEDKAEVRSNQLCRSTARKMAAKLKECPAFVGSNVLGELKRVDTEAAFEAAMDKVWSKAEQHRVLLVA